MANVNKNKRWEFYNIKSKRQDGKGYAIQWHQHRLDLETQGREIGDDKYGRTGARRGGGRAVLQR